jgi:hypothetical protein
MLLSGQADCALFAALSAGERNSRLALPGDYVNLPCCGDRILPIEVSRFRCCFLLPGLRRVNPDVLGWYCPFPVPYRCCAYG